MIWEELNSALIFTDLDATNNADVLEKVGAALIKEDYAKDTYVEALLKREAEFPTGLDVDGVGVAIPHTDVSHVKVPGVAIAVLKNPVDFIQMGSDDDKVSVSIVFMLAVVNPQAHLEKLQRILAIIQDSEVLKNIKSVKSSDEIIGLIKNKENTL
ncbi:MAG: PTS sugar transporter subunit IIA [Erysipelotrichaceae bacterium]|nr:PTS sugar transporter subunit IIA [Erysipelotrichaceae bacterium]MDD3810635.1 PTS sugar transporter subunit IIA [Erysipelotrichaceae bacterium]